MGAARWTFSPRGLLSLALVAAVSLFAIEGVDGQAVKFKNQPVPASETLKHESSPFYIFGKGVQFFFPKEAVGKQNSVTIKNLKLSRKSTEEIQQVIDQDIVAGRAAGDTPQGALTKISPAGVEVALIKYSQLMRMLNEPSPVQFCCHGLPFGNDRPFIPTAECPYPNAFRRLFWSKNQFSARENPQQPPQNLPGEVQVYDGEEVYVRPVALHGSPEAKQETTFVVRDSDIYFLVTANCGPLSDLTYDGEIEVVNAYGKLPGYKYSGYVSDLVCVVAYAALTLIWGICLLRQKNNLIPFHYCLGGVALLGLFESAAELWNVYHWNLYGPSRLPLFISIGFSVLKDISAYVLVLLGALGWSITRPRLDKKTVCKIQLIVLTYIVFDSLR